MKKPLADQVLVVLAARRRPRPAAERVEGHQTTGEPKPVDAPDKLDETIPGDPGAR